MWQLGPLAFAAPWLLLALPALPLLWWLLRVSPPAPRTQAFPAIRLLRDLPPTEETPHRTPWWLLLLRLAEGNAECGCTFEQFVHVMWGWDGHQALCSSERPAPRFFRWISSSEMAAGVTPGMRDA